MLSPKRQYSVTKSPSVKARRRATAKKLRLAQGIARQGDASLRLSERIALALAQLDGLERLETEQRAERRRVKLEQERAEFAAAEKRIAEQEQIAELEAMEAAKTRLRDWLALQEMKRIAPAQIEWVRPAASVAAPRAGLFASVVAATVAFFGGLI